MSSKSYVEEREGKREEQAGANLRLSALLLLYIHPLYGPVSKIPFSISIFSAPIILYIILYPLWGPLVTLSKYIHVRSSFEGFIETNLMV